MITIILLYWLCSWNKHFSHSASMCRQCNLWNCQTFQFQL